MTPTIPLAGRLVGPGHRPLVVPEIGINHEGSMAKALRMVDDAVSAGAEIVKFQCHVVDDEMIPAAKKVIPGNADVSIWDIMARCAFDEAQEREVIAYCREKGVHYLSTPFSRAAADRLERMGADAYKIGSGECNNTPLIDHVASFGKPVILSTGMNDLASVARSVEVLERRGVPYALLHCTSMYPTPWDKVRLGALPQMAAAFPRAVLGLSCHSLGNWTCFGAVPLGACILEKHFTSDKGWPGPDVPISIDPRELAELIEGSAAIAQALGGEKAVLPEEQVTIDFAYACVVTTRPVAAGEPLTRDNTWVKRPGTGEIKAAQWEGVLGRRVSRDLPADVQVAWSDLQD
jgi:sialic acid synthase SpsE